MFDFIRKKSPNANQSGDGTPVTSSNAPSMPQTVNPTDPQMDDTNMGEAQSAMPVPSRNQSYNGIGTPPSGKSYNGIGTPPSGKSYNGIGNPPSGKSYNGIGPTPSGEDPYNGIGSASKKSSPDSMMDVGQKKDSDQKTDIKGDSLKSNISATKRNDLDVMTHLTQRSNKVFVEANNKAKLLKNTYMDSEHLLHGLLADGQIYTLMTEMKIQPQTIEEELNKNYKKETSIAKPQVAPRVKLIVDKSLVIARKTGYEFVSPEQLLLALYEEGEGVGARILVKLGVKKEDLNKKITGRKEGFTDKEAKDNLSQQKRKSALEEYTIDLTAKAANNELDPVVERSDVIERVVHILSRRIKNNPALIGEPGVGKTAVVEGLAQRIVSKQVPESLLSKRILQLDLASVVAGASHRGEFEERMKNVVDELKGAKGEIIMFIDEMHTMMGAGGGEGSIDASNFIKPALARGEIQFIGATTITEYRKYIEKDAALERRFQTVVVPEPTAEAAIKMLKASRDKYEAFHKVKISDEVIDLAVKLSKRYIGDRFLPDKAFDLMDEGAAAVRLPLISLPEEIKSLEDRVSQLNQEVKEDEKKGEKVKARIARSKIDDIEGDLKTKKDEYSMKKASTTTEVTPEIVKDLIAKRTGIPLSKISAKEGDNLVNLEDIIHKRMINQEGAVKSVAQAIRRGRAGLKSTARPIGSFVFLGPTGVGKTELAKTISEVLFDEEEAVIRFDMTEYMERHEVAKLLGPPPGYVGFEDGGKLTESVRRKPYAVVLFDEVEKAHPDIFNILLQILDDGRLTDNKGRTISFKNTVVICTSNIGTSLIQQEMMKSGNVDVSEPTMVSTYVFTPRGREILTIGNKYYERDGANAQALQNQISATNTVEPKLDNMPKPTVSWVTHAIPDYFAGQKVSGNIPVEKKEEESVEGQPKEEKELTNEAADELAKQETKSVGFPMMGYDTQAISSTGREVVTKGSTVYSRSATTAKEWNVTTLIEYFKDHVVINALPDAPDEQLPTVRLKTHAFTPDEQEIVTFKERYWRRKPNSTDWETGTLKDYFKDQKAEADIQFPTTHWDIHAFSPAGREIVIVGNDIWFHDAAQPWKKQTLDVYFGADFPLEQEMTEKQKMDEDTDKKKYSLIKNKVMNELLKFFRPELVNRFDEVIIFEPLKFIHMIEIVKLQLKGLAKLLEEQEMGFSATDTAVKEIVRSGFDPLFGARPLRRAIQRLIENPISELIIAKKVQAGDTIIVDFNGEEFVFNVERVERKAATTGEKGEKGASVSKTFFCEKCANTFTTEVTDHSTPICSKCGSKSLQEVAGQTKETISGATDTKKNGNNVEPTVSGLESDPKPIAEKKEATNPSGQQTIPDQPASPPVPPAPAPDNKNANLADDVNILGLPN